MRLLGVTSVWRLWPEHGNGMHSQLAIAQIGKNVGCAEDIFFSHFVARINDSSGQSAARNGANSCCFCLGD